MRTVIDIIVAFLLSALLLWCGLLMWGAYSQHRLAILINADVLKEMVQTISRQTTNQYSNKSHAGGMGSQPSDQGSMKADDLPSKESQEIGRLEDAQHKLFDSSTLSFTYQFISIIILTIGISILGLMYSSFRREQDRAAKAEKATQELIQVLPPFIVGRNTTVVLATKYCLVFSLCRFLVTAAGSSREQLLIMILDYQGDILRHLENALTNREGLEPLSHEVILDMADRIDRELSEMRDGASPNERTVLDRICLTSARCKELLWENGKEFVDIYEDQWRKILGEERKTSVRLHMA